MLKTDVFRTGDDGDFALQHACIVRYGGNNNAVVADVRSRATAARG
jgi:hypothetical protein